MVNAPSVPPPHPTLVRHAVLLDYTSTSELCRPLLFTDSVSATDRTSHVTRWSKRPMISAEEATNHDSVVDMVRKQQWRARVSAETGQRMSAWKAI